MAVAGPFLKGDIELKTPVAGKVQDSRRQGPAAQLDTQGTVSRIRHTLQDTSEKEQKPLQKKKKTRAGSCGGRRRGARLERRCCSVASTSILVWRSAVVSSTATTINKIIAAITAAEKHERVNKIRGRRRGVRLERRCCCLMTYVGWMFGSNCPQRRSKRFYRDHSSRNKRTRTRHQNKIRTKRKKKKQKKDLPRLLLLI